MNKNQEAKVCWRTGYLHSLNVFLYQILIIPKGKVVNFIMKNPGKHHTNQMSKINIPSNKTTPCHVPLDMIWCSRTGMTFKRLQPKMKNLDHHEQISNKSKLRDILKSNLSVFFENIKVMEDKEILTKNYSVLKNIKVTRQLMQYTILDWDSEEKKKKD